jgi:hypothetical protein
VEVRSLTHVKWEVCKGRVVEKCDTSMVIVVLVHK